MIFPLGCHALWNGILRQGINKPICCSTYPRSMCLQWFRSFSTKGVRIASLKHATHWIVSSPVFFTDLFAADSDYPRAFMWDQDWEQTRGAWVAQSVEHPTSAQSWSHGLWVWAPCRALGWQLRAWSLLQILCLPLSLPLPCSCSVSLSVKNKNNIKKI